MSNKPQSLQDPFLNLLRREQSPVAIYLVNGIKLQGRIVSYDLYVILLEGAGTGQNPKPITQMVYKHSISTIVPGKVISLADLGTAGAGDEQS